MHLHLLTLEERVTLGDVLLYLFLNARYYASVFAGHETPNARNSLMHQQGARSSSPPGGRDVTRA